MCILQEFYAEYSADSAHGRNPQLQRGLQYLQQSYQLHTRGISFGLIAMLQVAPSSLNYSKLTCLIFLPRLENQRGGPCLGLYLAGSCVVHVIPVAGAYLQEQRRPCMRNASGDPGNLVRGRA